MAFSASITGDYAIASNTCAATLAPEAVCDIGVTFTPTASGTRSGALTFTDTAIKRPQTVKLSGVGD